MTVLPLAYQVPASLDLGLSACNMKHVSLAEPVLTPSHRALPLCSSGTDPAGASGGCGPGGCQEDAKSPTWDPSSSLPLHLLPPASLTPSPSLSSVPTGGSRLLCQPSPEIAWPGIPSSPERGQWKRVISVPKSPWPQPLLPQLSPRLGNTGRIHVRGWGLGERVGISIKDNKESS